MRGVTRRIAPPGARGRGSLPGREKRAKLQRPCYGHAMAVPEFYSGKTLYPAIAVLIGLSALFGLAILPRLAPRGGGMTGKPAPALSVPVVANGDAGARLDLANLMGQAVVLDFWATHC